MPRPRRGRRSRRARGVGHDVVPGRRRGRGTGTGPPRVVLKIAPTTARAPPRWPFSRARRVRTSARSAPVGSRGFWAERRGRCGYAKRSRIRSRSRRTRSRSTRAFARLKRQRRLRRLPPFSSSPTRPSPTRASRCGSSAARWRSRTRARGGSRAKPPRRRPSSRRRRRRRAPLSLRRGRSRRRPGAGAGAGAGASRDARGGSERLRAARRVMLRRARETLDECLVAVGVLGGKTP